MHTCIHYAFASLPQNAVCGGFNEARFHVCFYKNIGYKGKLIKAHPKDAHYGAFKL